MRKAMSRTSIAKARRTKWWSASVPRIVDRGPVVAAEVAAGDAEVEVVAAAVGIMAVVTVDMAVMAEAAVVVKNISMIKKPRLKAAASSCSEVKIVTVVPSEAYVFFTLRRPRIDSNRLSTNPPR